MERDRYHHGDLRAAVLASASARVAESGDQAVVLREIAREVGVSPTAVYRHFGSREELLRVLAAEALEGLADALTAAVGDRVGVERIDRLAQAYLTWGVREPHRFRLAFGPFGVGHPDGILGAPAAGPRAQQAFVAAAGEVAVTLWGLVHGITALAVEGTFGGPRRARSVLEGALGDVDRARWARE